MTASVRHRETWPVRSRGFRDWLLHRFYLETGSALSGGAIWLVIKTIGARARFDAPTFNVQLRVGGDNNKIYLDLSDPEWRAVEIDLMAGASLQHCRLDF